MYNTGLDYAADDDEFENLIDTSCNCADCANNEGRFEDKCSPLDEDLYPGSPITVKQFVLGMGLLKSDLNLPDTHTCKILKFVLTILPKPNICPSSNYKFKKYFNEADDMPLKKHFYCPNCVFSVNNTVQNVNNAGSIDIENISETVVSCDCNGKENYFIEIPLIRQLESLYRRPGFYNKLNHRDIVVDNGYLNDVYDGSIYQELTKGNNILSNKNNISLMWYTDGISIFKSSKFNVWGFLLIILELPYEERFKLENVLFVSLWFGNKKPAPNLYLEPIEASLKKLYKGINLYVQDVDKNITVRGLVVCGTADLPAKAGVLNMIQHNGRFGCPVCDQEGCIVDRVRTYPYDKDIILRTEEDVLECSMQALEVGKPVCGVKGPSMLSKICPRFITSTAVDVMHCVFEGVAKKLIELWFDTKFAGEDYNISEFTQVVDDRLCSIKPPAFVARRPRCIKTDFNYWKASELKNWFFYYSIPVLSDILPRDYLDHYKYLVLAIYILCRENIKHEEVNFAENLIHEFLSRYEMLYGIKNMTCNTHSTQHLPDVVRRLGPLWTTSCFPLENINGQMKKLVHGSKNPELQIVSNFNMQIKIHTLKYEWLQEGSDMYNFCKTLSSSEKKLKLTKIENNIYLVGCASKIQSLDAQQVILDHDLPGCNLFYFKKLYKNRTLYTSELDQKDKKTTSYYVTYCEDNVNIKIGIIQRYIRVTNCDCKKLCECPGKNYACIKQISTTNPFGVNIEGRTLEYIHEYVNISDNVSMIDVKDLKNVCIYVKLENEKSYVCEPVNSLELE